MKQLQESADTSHSSKSEAWKPFGLVPHTLHDNAHPLIPRHWFWRFSDEKTCLCDACGLALNEPEGVVGASQNLVFKFGLTGMWQAELLHK